MPLIEAEKAKFSKKQLENFKFFAVFVILVILVVLSGLKTFQIIFTGVFEAHT